MNKQQSGFTLVEIAIVLVIIGLLLGGVLKGQELINSAKVKNMVSDFRTVPTLIYGYQDRFRVFPGDQTQAQLTAAFGTTALGAPLATACKAATAGCVPGNGRMDGNWNDLADSETYVFWQHVRLANLATGTVNLGTAEYEPRNADGGRIGIEGVVLNAGGAANPWIAGMRGSFYVCSDNIVGRLVRQIDTSMDDGNTAAGSVQAVLAGSGRGTLPTATAAIVDNQQYIVCAAF
ncbi:prepilin-type N-terminal cleavage/methylation domain-containing protein [Accumulibacter sp.]|uniref:prepilin-type N-terminal cleavage/methylation domain-containing protein n=1 Tax=Accumulibacter sp. TaxID=2053492 RepID=UPI0026324798|nr:prepilin-type N-terminal cleavage/methylation domain-containing protein [Accumulibacter sp.]